MALSMDTQAWLDKEGLVVVDKLEDFKSDQLLKAINNLRMKILGVELLFLSVITIKTDISYS